MQLPWFSTNPGDIKQAFNLLQTQWRSILNPLIGNPLNNVSIITVSLKTGTNTINHLLGKTQQGWFEVDIDGPAMVYRSKPFNDKTLTLTSSADVDVYSIGVF